jgi:hypothetical protein
MSRERLARLRRILHEKYTYIHHGRERANRIWLSKETRT